MDFKKLFILNEKTDTYEWLFHIGMLIRILYGFARLLLAFILLPLVGTPLVALFGRAVEKNRHLFDSQDFFLQTAVPFVEHHSAAFFVTYFLVSYLVFWGVIDIVLSVSLLKHKLWAFPVSVYLIVLFIIYELFRFTHTHSLVLAYIIIFDSFLIWLIRREYMKLLRKAKIESEKEKAISKP
jgi:uncharacterized membrane protein